MYKGNQGRWLRKSSRQLRKISITCSKLKKTSNITIFELGDRHSGPCLGDLEVVVHYFFSRLLTIRTSAFRICKLNWPTPSAKFPNWHICKIFGSKKSKIPGKTASGGQSLADRGFWRYVSCSLESKEQPETKKFSTPCHLIGLNCDLRKAVFSTFKGLCLPDKTEFDRFSGMYEFVWVSSFTWYQKLDFDRVRPSVGGTLKVIPQGISLHGNPFSRLLDAQPRD